MKKVTKMILIGVAVDMFYGHLYAIWRNVNPENFNWFFEQFFEQKDNLYKKIGLDKLWKKTED